MKVAYTDIALRRATEIFIDNPDSWELTEFEVRDTKDKIARVAKTWEKIK